MSKEKIKILVVDDMEDSRKLIEGKLKDKGFAVEIAVSGEEAIEIVMKVNGKFDFIIMDQVLLGGIDGITTTKTINEKFPKIRTIVMTMYGDGESSRTALEAGAYRYVFRSPDLDEAILDVTSLIESAGELSKVENKLEDLFWRDNVLDNTDIAVGIVDRTYRVLYANKKQREIAGKDCTPGGICWVEWHQAFYQKGPCPWCPVKPMFEGQDTSMKVVPLFKKGRLQYWQTGTSPIRDSKGQIIAALKWGLDVTDREYASRTALEAKSLDERLKSALEQIRILGYSRARLYELSEDDNILLGRTEAGGTGFPISKSRILVEEYPYFKRSLSTRIPHIYHPKDKKKIAKYMRQFDLKGIDEWLDIPLWTNKERIIGKIIVDNKITGYVRPDRASKPRLITEEHFDSLVTIAGFAANSIQETREHERTVREVELQRQLREIDAEITKELKFDPLLRSIIQRSVELLNGSGGVLLLCDKEKKQLEVVVTYKLDILKGMTFSFGEGLTGTVAQTRESMFMNNYFDDPRHSKKMDPAQYRNLFRSLLGVPIIWHNEVIGVLSVVDKTKGRIFNNYDIELLESLSSHAAIAIENSRLFEKVEKQAKEMAGLFELGKAITASLKLYEVMEKIFESTRNLLPFENGLIFLPDKDPDEFTVKAFFGYEENYIKEQRFTFRKGQGYTGWIIKNKKPLLIEDSKSRTDIKPLYPYIKKNKLLRSFMGVPLIVRDQVVGVFEITSEKPQVFKKEHLNLLRAFADQLAIAIDRARLFEETDNRARQLASLYDTGRSILSNLTLDEVLKKIANSAKEVLKADIVDLYQYDTDQNDFIMPPTLVGDRHFPKLIPQKLSNNALVVKVVREMKPRYFSKAQKEPDLIKPKPLQPEEVWKPKNRFVIREKIKSSALIPCIAKGVVVGVLCVSYRTSIHFTPHEKEIIEIFATLAATAIENARLHKTTDEELNKRVKELSSLRRADGAMVSTLEIDRVIKVILDEIRQLIGADCALVRLYRKEIRDGTPDVLVLAEVKGSYEGEIPKYNPFGSGISGVAAQTRKTVIENNLDNSSIHSEALKYYANPEEKKYLKWIKSVVTTPLISKGELKGVLCALKPVKDGFLNIDLNIVESFASRAAIAIDNALLKSQQEERI